MISIIVWSVILIISLIILIKSSDWFTDAAEKIGLHFGMSPFLVGVTIVAIGTSLPELASSIMATLKGVTEVVSANVIGSNIANIFLVLGMAAIISKKLKIARELIHVDLPLFIGSVFLLLVTVWDGKFTAIEGIISLLVLIVYLSYTFNSEKENDEEIKKEMKEELKRKKLRLKTWLILLLSGIFIWVGAKYVIDAVIKISEIMNLGTETIALTAVALGTSLPELMVTISAAKKGKAEIAVGNVLGSNIFNTLAVMGIPSLFRTIEIPADIINFSLPIMIIASIMYLLITQDKKITKWEGWFLVIFYVLFIGKIIGIM